MQCQYKTLNLLVSFQQEIVVTFCTSKALLLGSMIPIHFQDTLMYVDLITRQTYDYATPITCDDNPRNFFELDRDSDDQDFTFLALNLLNASPQNTKHSPHQFKTLLTNFHL